MPCDEVGIPSLREIDANEKMVGLPEDVPALTSLYLYIAGSCNLACRHCWIMPSYQHGGKDGPFMKLDYVAKGIHEAIPLGLQVVKLTGGEPTLHPHFKEIVRLIHDAGLRIMLETNGTLIDRSLAEFMMRQEVSFISVSLDGATADMHDALRSVPGSFDQAIGGIKSLVEAGFHPQIICTLYRGNVGQIDQISELAEQLSCSSLKFNVIQQIGRGQKLAREAGLSIQEVLRWYEYINNGITLNGKLKIYFDIPIAFYPIRKLLSGELNLCNMRHVLGMLAGGELCLCGIGVSVQELVYGNIEVDDLRAVWCQSPGLIRLRELVPTHLEGICSHCLHRDLCHGDCIANNYYNSGRLNAPYYFCESADKLGIFPISRKIV